MEQIKYVLKGKTQYFTPVGFKEYLLKLYKNSGIPEYDDIDDITSSILSRLHKYDGDPYGHIKEKDPVGYDMHHSYEASGKLYLK